MSKVDERIAEIIEDFNKAGEVAHVMGDATCSNGHRHISILASLDGRSFVVEMAIDDSAPDKSVILETISFIGLPGEVEASFKSLEKMHTLTGFPKDSFPLMPAEISVGHPLPMSQRYRDN